IVVDASGNTYITGNFRGLADFNPGTGIFNLETGFERAFYLKLNTAGNFEWALMSEFSRTYEAWISFDANGNLHTTGLISESGSSLLPYISKIDTSGNFISKRFLPYSLSTQSIYVSDFAIDQDENLYLTGGFINTADFDSTSSAGSLTAQGNNDIFVAKYNATGGFVWVKHFEGDHSGAGSAIDLDDSGNIYVTGSFRYTVDFDPGPEEYLATVSFDDYPEGSDGFLLKLTNDGGFDWVKTFGAFRSDVGYDVAITTDSIYLTGSYGDIVDFDLGENVFSRSNYSIERRFSIINTFISRYDLSGNFIWTESTRGESYIDGPIKLAVDENESVFVTGSFNGTKNFYPRQDSYNVSSIPGTSWNAFLWKLVQSYPPEVIVNQPVISGIAGEIFTNSGTFSDMNPGDTVSLSVNFGSIIQHSNGTWSWSYTPSVNEFGTKEVVITAVDNHGATAFKSFELDIQPFLNYFENFDDETADLIDYYGANRWAIVNSYSGGKALQFNGSNSYGLGVAYLNLGQPIPAAYEISATVYSASGANRWIDGFLVFDYQSPSDFKYAGFFGGQNEWVIGHYQGNWSNKLAVVDWDDTNQDVKPNQFYRLHLSVDGNQVLLHVDGLPVCSTTFTEGIGAGQLGLAGYNSVTQFDSFAVSNSISAGKPQPLPFQEDFNDGSADGFYYPLMNNWATVNSNGEQFFRINNSVNNQLGLTYVPLPEDTPSAFEVSVQIKSIQAVSGWQDGFIIFDYKSPTDFKYAGMFTGQNQWLIGHYQGNWNNRFSVVDWDDTGRDILTNQFYTLHLRIDGNTVWLSVDGEYITSATFSGPVNMGAVGLAADKAFTWFDNFEVAEKVDAGAPTDLPYYEDFNNGYFNHSTYYNPALWSVQGSGSDKYLEINAANNKGLGIGRLNNDWLLPNNYEFAGQITSISGPNRWLDGFLVFDYQSPTDFKYAGMFTGQNQWVIGHYQGNWGNRLAQVDWDDVGQNINVNTPYQLHLKIEGDHVILRVNGLFVAEATYAEGIHNGTIGVAAYNAVTRFDNLMVDTHVGIGQEQPLPYTENFDDSSADHFYYNNAAVWGFANYGSNKVFRANTSGGNGNAIAYLTVENTNSNPLIISADIRSNPVTSGWQDGFIIFDYKNVNDFKFAGFFTGQNTWVIGHYLGNWNNTLTVIDWDDTGRSINTSQFYHLDVQLDGTSATLIVDGETIASTDFGTNISQGAVGLAAANAFTWFDNFNVQPMAASAPLADPLFANWNEESEGLLI
ncbi:MAG: hypothetical protein KDA65_05435, partial [Planctomycetaceae bacterium]|nr:hypothetical protein [Planctomycetaceae bacterium]